LVTEGHGISLPTDRINVKYAATYYFISQLDSYLKNDLILSRYLSDYFETAIWDYITPFPKWTALHMFSGIFAELVLEEDFDRAAHLSYAKKGSCQSCSTFPPPSAHLLAADLCRIHSLDSSALDEVLHGWHHARACCAETGQAMSGSDLEDAWSDWKLQEGYEQLLAQLSEEMFFVLFANRSFLRRFNLHIALRIGHLDETGRDHSRLLHAGRDGRTRLVRKDPPEWAKRAVFFRDRGYCCSCGRNLENSHSPINNAQYDHIVPLAAGGMNDATNLQLLCKYCNNRKRGHITNTSDVYERWYPIDREYKPTRADTLESVILRLFSGED
jgi:hypothetical protein